MKKINLVIFFSLYFMFLIAQTSWFTESCLYKNDKKQICDVSAYGDYALLLYQETTPNGDYNLFLQSTDENGLFCFGTPVSVFNDSFDQKKGKLLRLDNNNYLIFWIDERNGISSINAIKSSGYGAFLWSDKKVIFTSTNTLNNLSANADSINGFYITWTETISSTINQIKFTHCDALGNNLLPNGFISLETEVKVNLKKTDYSEGVFSILYTKARYSELELAIYRFNGTSGNSVTVSDNNQNILDDKNKKSIDYLNFSNNKTLFAYDNYSGDHKASIKMINRDSTLWINQYPDENLMYLSSYRLPNNIMNFILVTYDQTNFIIRHFDLAGTLISEKLYFHNLPFYMNSGALVKGLNAVFSNEFYQLVYSYFTVEEGGISPIQYNLLKYDLQNQTTLTTFIKSTPYSLINEPLFISSAHDNYLSGYMLNDANQANFYTQINLHAPNNLTINDYPYFNSISDNLGSYYSAPVFNKNYTLLKTDETRKLAIINTDQTIEEGLNSSIDYSYSKQKIKQNSADTYFFYYNRIILPQYMESIITYYNSCSLFDSNNQEIFNINRTSLNPIDIPLIHKQENGSLILIQNGGVDSELHKIVDRTQSWGETGMPIYTGSQPLALSDNFIAFKENNKLKITHFDNNGFIYNNWDHNGKIIFEQTENLEITDCNIFPYNSDALVTWACVLPDNTKNYYAQLISNNEGTVIWNQPYNLGHVKNMQIQFKNNKFMVTSQNNEIAPHLTISCYQITENGLSQIWNNTISNYPTHSFDTQFIGNKLLVSYSILQNSNYKLYLKTYAINGTSDQFSEGFLLHHRNRNQIYPEIIAINDNQAFINRIEYISSGENLLFTDLINLNSFTPSDNQETIPTTFKLYKNYPNPFNPSTTISFDLPKDCSVELNIYNIKGQLVRNIFNGSTKAGHHEFNWNGKTNTGLNAPSGIYFTKIKYEQQTQIGKMSLIK